MGKINEKIVRMVVQKAGDLREALTFYDDEGAQQGHLGITGASGGGGEQMDILHDFLSVDGAIPSRFELAVTTQFYQFKMAASTYMGVTSIFATSCLLRYSIVYCILYFAHGHYSRMKEG